MKQTRIQPYFYHHTLWSSSIFSDHYANRPIHILNHFGEDRERGYYAVVPPIVQSGNFTYPTVAAIRAVVQQEMEKLCIRGASTRPLVF